MPGNSASYDNLDEGISDIVATLQPHPEIQGSCQWHTTLQLAAGPKFRDSDYIDMVSFRGAGQSNYGAGTRMFFKGQQVYNNVLPGPASCDDTVSTRAMVTARSDTVCLLESATRAEQRRESRAAYMARVQRV